MKDKYSEYGELTLEKLRENIHDFNKKYPSKFPFSLPMGQIGNTGVYRLSDNCLTGISGWNSFMKEMKKQAGEMIKDTNA